MNNRQEVTIEIDNIDLYELDGLSMDEVSNLFLDYKQKGYNDVYISVEESYSPDSHDGFDILVKGRRLENDTEYSKRLSKEKQVAETKKEKLAQKDKQEYEDYLRLKTKYEDK